MNIAEFTNIHRAYVRGRDVLWAVWRYATTVTEVRRRLRRHRGWNARSFM